MYSGRSALVFLRLPSPKELLHLDMEEGGRGSGNDNNTFRGSPEEEIFPPTQEPQVKIHAGTAVQTG